MRLTPNSVAPSRSTISLALPAALALLAVLAAACGSTEATDSSEPTPAATASDQATTPPAPSASPAEGTPQSAPSPTGDSAPALAPVTIPDDLSLELTAIAEIDRPIDLAYRPGHPNLFVATKGGTVLEVETDGTGGRVVGELIDIGAAVDDGFESGLLGLTFSPDGSHLYLHYSDRDHNNAVVEIPMDRPELSAGRTLLQLEQPAGNHNGGDLAFGPDGHLYVAFGDGGGAGDPFDTGQDPTTWLGSILRIEPTGDDPYLVPSDNPFTEGSGAPEVFIYGVRNPWRISFDRATGDLWVADVGQDAVEEVNVLYAGAGGGNGANLGWSLVEGSAPFAASEPPQDSYVAPIFEYGQDEGCSVTGGYVYRGTAIPELTGSYVFGDFCGGVLWGLTSSESQGLLGRFELGLSIGDAGLASFGEGPDGELYVLSFDNTVYRIDPAS